jgi:O-antigen ligase
LAIAAALLFVAAMAVTPILHPTAPFLITVPGTDLTLAPAGRLLTWLDALRNFAANPLLGRGIGVGAVDVHFSDPSGNWQSLTDAHNTYLILLPSAAWSA